MGNQKGRINRFHNLITGQNLDRSLKPPAAQTHLGSSKDGMRTLKLFHTLSDANFVSIHVRPCCEHSLDAPDSNLYSRVLGKEGSRLTLKHTSACIENDLGSDAHTVSKAVLSFHDVGDTSDSNRDVDGSSRREAKANSS